MERCEMCLVRDRTSLLTKCCQLFICQECRDKYDKLAACSCGKPMSKKWCETDPKLFQALQEFWAGQPIECSRCEESTGLQYCQQCDIQLCQKCFEEVHAKGEYEKHTSISKSQLRKVLQQRRNHSNREQLCHQHRTKKEYICQCSQQPMCSNCLRAHRQSCGRKYRGLAQFKKQYFSSMLNKLQQLTDCKMQLTKSCSTYKQHFEKQRQLKESCQQLIKDSFFNIERLLEFKKAELKRSLDKYWEECLAVFQKNLICAEAEDRKYDDYGRLVERLADKMVGLDYLDRRITRKSLQCESFCFRLVGLETLEKEMLAITATSKKWEAERLQEQQVPPMRARKLSSVFENQTPQVLTQIHQDPLHSRPLKLVASSTEFQYEFIHLPYQKEQYEIEFGVGMKVKGQEVFKKMRADNTGRGIVCGLNPQTNYRVRMRVVNGVWGPISEITTLQPQNFVTSNCSFAKGDNKGMVMFLRSGTLYATNPLEFGIHTWEVKIVVDKNSHSESETACVSFGVSNRQAKKALFVGTTLNYGYQRDNFKVKLVVDCSQRRMVISNEKQQEQVYQNLPDLPLYPTIVNKGNSTVQLNIVFLPSS